jgi:uncharacterized protein YlxW (UPF0749 family)
MGLFWDLVQQSQISDQQTKAESLEDRISQLEIDLASTKALLNKTLRILEEVVGKDIDGDGITG